MTKENETALIINSLNSIDSRLEVGFKSIDDLKTEVGLFKVQLKGIEVRHENCPIDENDFKRVMNWSKNYKILLVFVVILTVLAIGGSLPHLGELSKIIKSVLTIIFAV